MSVTKPETIAYRDPVELVPQTLYAVGGLVPLDGLASWAPAGPGLHPASSYVFAGDGPLVVDPGLPGVAEGVLGGLEQLVRGGSDIKVFLTRAQMDCVGNVRHLMRHYRVAEIFTGGVTNPFDQFDEVLSAGAEGRSEEVDMIVLRSPEETRLSIFKPDLRLLTTFWGYDEQTGALFTSDSFTHTTVACEDDLPVITSDTSDGTTLDDVRAHLYSGLWWVQHAETSDIARSIEEFFSSTDVTLIAPSRGCVLKGKEVVERHVEMLLSVLAEPAKVI